jgi:hypothetical protein
MAKIVPLHGEMSGSIGDNTFSHNKGGPYVRRRAVPTNPTTTKQTAVRAILATLSSAWSGLTDDQRTAWNLWASINPVVDSLGTSFQLSGHQAYIKLNTRLLQAGTARVDDPPTGTGPAQFPTLTPTVTAPGTISIVYAPTPMAAGERMLIWMTMPSGAGRDPNFKAARLAAISAAADASPVAATTPYIFASGNVFNLYVQRMDANGQVSPVQKLRVTVP